MLNNVVSHSEASRTIFEFKIENHNIVLSISDNGIGIFEKIWDYLKLEDPRESIRHLVKGKLTTNPEKHSGEGIFFTSRVFDEFSIYSGNFMFMRQNREEGWLLEYREWFEEKGTLIQLTIDMDSHRNIAGV
ncbi:MAG: hypothetical protein VYC17_03040 [Nitrospinota bacterium]|nr:hypothetical protein [Nitrospinota bacterium]